MLGTEAADATKISIQLYSVIAELKLDEDAVLARLAEIGFTRVEAFDFVQRPAAAAAALRRHGLTAETAHAALLTADRGSIAALPLERTIEAAVELGAKYLIEPHVPAARWTSRTDIEVIAEGLNDAAILAERYGLRVGYHNHGHELAQLIDGAPALEILATYLASTVVLEVDLYWAAAARVDPVGLVERLGDRVIAVHVKDGAIGPTTANTGVPEGQTAAGCGDVPLREAIAAATALEYAVVEFDSYPDVLAGVEESHRFLRRLGMR